MERTERDRASVCCGGVEGAALAARPARRSLNQNTKLRPEQIDQLVAGYEAGRNIRSLGREFDIHEQTVRAQLRRRGVELRPDGRKLTEHQRAEVARAYAAGTSTYRLAKDLGVSPDTVLRILYKAGVTRRGRKGAAS